jgi:predicted transcriptional regulator
MPASTTMTIRISPDVKAKLGRLAQGTRRSRSFLAGEAVEAYVERELEIIDGIQHGLADAAAGRVVPHDEAEAELQAVIAAGFAAQDAAIPTTWTATKRGFTAEGA